MDPLLFVGISVLVAIAAAIVGGIHSKLDALKESQKKQNNRIADFAGTLQGVQTDIRTIQYVLEKNKMSVWENRIICANYAPNEPMANIARPDSSVPLFKNDQRR